jgi:hypothetical protein
MFMVPQNLFQGMNSASLRSLAGRYDNLIPPRFLVPIDFLKIPALATRLAGRYDNPKTELTFSGIYEFGYRNTLLICLVLTNIGKGGWVPAKKFLY